MDNDNFSGSFLDFTIENIESLLFKYAPNGGQDNFSYTSPLTYLCLNIELLQGTGYTESTRIIRDISF